MKLTLEQNSIISHLLKLDDTNLSRCMELLTYFIEEFPEAPGSSRNHQSYSGGYYKHINDILNYAKKMYKELAKMGKLEFSLSDAILVLFLHDIEKPIKYHPVYVKTGVVDENGVVEEEVIEYETDSDSDIRASLIGKFGILLNEEHIKALKYIHGEGQDYSKDKRVMSPLCAFCHCCDVISARIFYK